MIISFIGEFSKYEPFSFNCNSLKTAFSALRYKFGPALVKFIIENNFAYLLTDSSGKNKPVFLKAEVNATEFTGYDNLIIIPVLEGSTGIEEALVLAGAAATAASAAPTTVAFMGISMFTTNAIAGFALAAVGNIAIGLAASSIIHLLSPTPQFSNDPARSKAQNSNLFGNAPITLEEGGIVPIVMGQPFCSATLISSGIFTTKTVSQGLIFNGN